MRNLWLRVQLAFLILFFNRATLYNFQVIFRDKKITFTPRTAFTAPVPYKKGKRWWKSAVWNNSFVYWPPDNETKDITVNMEENGSFTIERI